MTTGNLFIVAAPSGGGKSSIVRELTERMSNIEISISHTTRNKRPGELDGQDYFFVDDETFETMVEKKEFVEHARVFGAWYGTSVKQIETRLQQGIDILLDIDWQGARRIKKLFCDAVSVFIVPPSLAILRERLEQRKRDSMHEIESRMREAEEEMSHFSEFDYLIVNDVFEDAVSDLHTIVHAYRLETTQQMHRQKELLSFLQIAQ